MNRNSTRSVRQFDGTSVRQEGKRVPNTCSRLLISLVGLALLASAWAATPGESKVFLYVLTEDGDLTKYDPDTDAVVQQLSSVGQGYIKQGDSDDVTSPNRVLDMARQKLMLINPRLPGEVVLLNLRQRTATKVAVHPPDSYSEILELMYPRKASRFYVHWVRKQQEGDPGEYLFTALDHTGQVLAAAPAPLDEFSRPIFHPDGRNFYVFRVFSRRVTLIDGETLATLGTYDLTPFKRPGRLGPGIPDVRGGRVLVGQGAGTRNDLLDPVSLFTLDLNFTPASATPRIDTGIGVRRALLTPNGQTIIAQEARDPDSASGAGRLHFFDVATGNKLGVVTFPARLGAVVFGYHPDGRRLFLNAWNLDPGRRDPVTNLVIVDVISRTVLRDREIQDMTLVHDFMDEP